MPKILILFSIFMVTHSLFAGGNYWQQEVDYNINVSLDVANKTLEGDIQMIYRNNADQHLDTIWIHIWPNAYSRYNTALAKQLLENNNLAMDMLDREDLGAIGHLNFKVDGLTAAFQKLEKDPDIGFIVLDSPLLPGESIEITTPFTVKVPASISRMGTGNGYFAITQWYPKPAVYDNDGWHPMPYLDQGEFYAEFGSYHVEITVPDNYVVAATGQLTAQTTSDSTITLIYDQDKIHDFAWFASPDFKIISEKAILANGHEVAINTYYLTESERWLQAHEYTKTALLLFSDLIGPYPYDHCTIVEGPLKAGGGMEYPMITILNDYDEVYLESVIAHEVAHNWWQGILASNERAAPWIDEGFSSYYDKRYNSEHAVHEYQPAKVVTERKVAKMFGFDGIDYASGEKILLRQLENRNIHQAVGLHAADFTDANTYFSLYAKAPHQIIYLEKYLGREQFDACIRSFFQAYQFKHIHPNDLQNHFEECSGKDLNFFFQDWINTDGVVDGSIGKVEKTENILKVEIKQKGEIVLPLPVTIITSNGEETIWVDGKSTIIDIPVEGLQEVIVDRDNLTLDYRPSNNYYKTKGIGKLESLRPQFLFGLDNNKRTEIFFSPFIGGNAHDKFMLGLTVYNRFYPSKNFDWDITPMYAFGSKQVNGTFNASYTQNIRKDRHVQLKYGTHFKTFSYDNRSFGGRYINVRPSLSVKILPKDNRKKITHQLNWTHHQTWKEINTQSSADAPIVKSFNGLWVEELGYGFDKKDLKTPVNAASNIQFNNEHAKLSATTNVKVRYGKMKSYFSARFWMSAIMAKQGDFAGSSQFGTSYATNLSGRIGSRDYLFEDYFLGRNVRDGFLSRQIAMNEGQFKFAPGTLLNSNILATSINLRADFPGKWIPIKLYTDIGIIYTNSFVSGNIEKTSLFAFQAGAMISLFNDAFEVYFPFFSSNDIKDYYDLNAPKYKQRICFALDLNKLNPHKIVEDFRF